MPNLENLIQFLTKLYFVCFLFNLQAYGKRLNGKVVWSQWGQWGSVGVGKKPVVVWIEAVG